MSKKEFFKSLKSKLIIVLALIALVCMSCFAFVACDEDTTSSTVKDPTYTYTPSEEDMLITNSNFASGAIALDNEKYPVAPTGWSRALDGSSKSSGVNSGVVSTQPSSWKALITKYVKDVDFSFYLKEKIAEKNQSGEISEDVLKPSDKLEDKIDQIIQHFFTNPGSSDNDNAVYMLNNYLNKSETLVGVGTAQKVTSSSKVSLSRGKYGVFTINVKTANIASLNSNDFGANIRVTNTFNGISQSDVAITNIISNDSWTEYKLYVQADELFDSTFTLVLGLGFGGNSSTDTTYYTEGTAYFDNINFEEITAEQFNQITFDSNTTFKLNFGDSKIKKISSGANKSFLYDMTFDTTNLLNDLTTINADYTKSTVDKDGQPITSQTLFGSTLTKNVTGDSVEIKDAKNIAYTIKLLANDGNNFVLNGDKENDVKGQYALIKFSVDNKLSDLSSTQLSVNVADVAKDGKVTMRKSVVLLSKVEEATEYTILVENKILDGAREFYIEIVIGAEKLSGDVYKDQLASGDLTINNIYYNIADIPDESADDLVYNFYGRNPSANVSLYAGYTDEPIETDESVSYTINPAPGDVGAIITEPAEIESYTPSRDLTSSDFSGVINTKYLNNYSQPSLNTALNHNTADEDIQPMVIYNSTPSSLGFIGGENSISTNSKGRVSVTLRVDDTAEAYIYLVDTSSKEVMTFENFTDVNGKEVNGNSLKFMLKVTNDMLDNDGWVTVSFYITTGTVAKSFRVEVWNGSKTSTQTEGLSQGYVFVKNIQIALSAEDFSTPDRVENAFTVAGNPVNPLFVQGQTSFTEGNIYKHIREVSDEEKEYNKNNPDSATEALPAYVWAKNDKFIYAVYETIDVAEFTADSSTSSDASGSGCSATTDPSTFWMSFSSILLGVVLVLAIIALIVKRVLFKRKANASDAKTHYTVRSRTSYKNKEQDDKIIDDVVEDDTTDVEPEQVEEISEEEQEATEQTLDSYVYGDVQDFGETETNEDIETSEEAEEQPEEKTEE